MTMTRLNKDQEGTIVMMNKKYTIKNNIKMIIVIGMKIMKINKKLRMKEIKKIF